MTPSDDEEFALPLPPAAPPSSSPPRRVTAQFGAVVPPVPPPEETFAVEMERLIRTRGKLFYIDLNKEQIDWLVKHCGSLHHKYGGR